ncbi:MAG: hypothetical protein OXI90_14260 [Gammaproteobacteria bacterium]|nr:hypothetical protein [Gammaproteobacteria bacterium]
MNDDVLDRNRRRKCYFVAWEGNETMRFSAAEALIEGRRRRVGLWITIATLFVVLIPAADVIIKRVLPFLGEFLD